MTKTFTDQLGHEITINYPPKRIISIVPSQTELLYDLGLKDEVTGITKFCIHPKDWYKTKTKVGGTKNLNIELIRSLNPDLILGNKEENMQSDIELLKQEFPVWISDIYTLEDALKTIREIGALVNRSPEAEYLAHLIQVGFTDLKTLISRSLHKEERVLYLIWRHPYMVAGTHTFIHTMLEMNGYTNAVTQSRYPELSISEIQKIQPSLVFLSSEPYPFKERHIDEIRSILPHAKIQLVDGEMFSWYGSRLVKAIQYFYELQDSRSS